MTPDVHRSRGPEHTTRSLDDMLRGKEYSSSTISLAAVITDRAIVETNIIAALTSIHRPGDSSAPLLVRKRFSSQGETTYDVIKGLHTAVTLKNIGEKSIEAKVYSETDISNDQLVDLRLKAAAESRKSLHFARFATYIIEGFADTPFAQKGITVEQAFEWSRPQLISPYGTRGVVDETELTALRKWVEAKAQACNMNVTSLQRNIIIPASKTDPDLVRETRNPGQGNTKKIEISPDHIELISTLFPGSTNYSLQRFLAEAAAKNSFSARELKELLTQMEHVLSKETLIEGIRTELRTAAAENTSLKQQMKNTTSKINLLHMQIAALQSRIKSSPTNKTVNSLIDQVEKLTQERNEARQEAAAAQKANKDFAAVRRKDDKERQQLTKAIDAAKQTTAELIARRVEDQARIAAFEEVLPHVLLDKARELETTNATIFETTQDRDTARNEAQNAVQRITELTAQIEQLTATNDDHPIVRRLREELIVAEQKKILADATIVNLRIKVTEATALPELEAANEKIANNERFIQNLQEQLLSRNNIISGLQSEIDRLNSQLAKMKLTPQRNRATDAEIQRLQTTIKRLTRALTLVVKKAEKMEKQFAGLNRKNTQLTQTNQRLKERGGVDRSPRPTTRTKEPANKSTTVYTATTEQKEETSTQPEINWEKVRYHPKTEGTEEWFYNFPLTAGEYKKVTKMIDDAARSVFPTELITQWETLRNELKFKTAEGFATGFDAIHQGISKRITEIAKLMKLSKDNHAFAFLSASFYASSFEESDAVDLKLMQNVHASLYEYQYQHGLSRTGEPLQLALYANRTDPNINQIYQLLIKPDVAITVLSKVQDHAKQYKTYHGDLRNIFAFRMLGIKNEY